MQTSIDNRLIFITFGSHANYIEAGQRLINQAKKLNIFSESFLYTAKYLRNDSYFWNKHGDFITNNKRGYGYWLWKPYIIRQSMNKMANGDILLYLDGGCEIDVNEKIYLLDCIEIVKQDKIVGTFTCVEKDYNKMDLILKMDMQNDKYLNTAQRQAGAVLYLVCDETRSLINEWYDLMCVYHNIDDTPSIAPNLPCFKEHRHDQSVFSLLTKKYDLYSSNNLRQKCIKTLHNRSGKSRLYKTLCEKNTSITIMPKCNKLSSNEIQKSEIKQTKIGLAKQRRTNPSIYLLGIKRI
jgi:hypothetical protein